MDKNGSAVSRAWARASAWLIALGLVATIGFVGHSSFWYPLFFLAFTLYDWGGGRGGGLVALGACSLLGVSLDVVFGHPIDPVLEPFGWASEFVALGLFFFVFTALWRSRRQAAEQAAQLRTLIDTLPVGVSILGEGRRVVLHNEELLRILRMAPEQMARSAYQARSYLKPDGSPLTEGEFATSRVLAGEPRAAHVTTGVVVEDGARIWVDVTATACHLGDWRVLTVTGDITALKDAEDRVRRLLEEKDTLLHEVHHRVKNNFLTVRSLLLLRAETAEPAIREALLVAAAQVQGMAEVYAELFQRPAEGLPSSALGDLALRVIGLFGRSSSVSLQLNLEGGTLPTEQASPLVILVNELVTNSLKHAWPPGTLGTISLSLLRQDTRWRLCYGDDGAGLTGTSQGFGLRLLEMLARSLEGALVREPEAGVQWSLEFPVRSEGLVGSESNR